MIVFLDFVALQNAVLISARVGVEVAPVSQGVREDWEPGYKVQALITVPVTRTDDFLRVMYVTLF